MLAIPVGAVSARPGEGAAVFADVIGPEVIHIGLAESNELYGKIMEFFEVVRSEKDPVFPVKPQPAYILHDRIHVFHGFLGRVGVVEAQVSCSAEFGRQTKIEANRFGVTDVQVAVRFGREVGDDAAVVLAGGEVRGHDLLDEVGGNGGSCRFWGRCHDAASHRLGVISK